MQQVRKEDVMKLVGKQIYALRKDGTVVEGKLVRISGNRLVVKPQGKQVKTSAILPLVLFDLLAIGTAPFTVALVTAVTVMADIRTVDFIGKETLGNKPALHSLCCPKRVCFMWR
ncbi:hypothetical protein LJK88_03835 [Paenibacillus sp. P26]|nr:hypothetical protein LJK88_03835 [Paenibacillus sp. P26]